MAGQLPSHARRTTDEQEVFRRLEKFHGIDAVTASDRLHEIKRQAGRGADDNVIFDLTGGVYDPNSLESLGTLTEGGK
jgi:hypothetical protein